VNGKLTAELLASIFMTRSPLHDGAVATSISFLICSSSSQKTMRAKLGSFSYAAIGMGAPLSPDRQARPLG